MTTTTSNDQEPENLAKITITQGNQGHGDLGSRDSYVARYLPPFTHSMTMPIPPADYLPAMLDLTKLPTSTCSQDDQEPKAFEEAFSGTLKSTILNIVNGLVRTGYRYSENARVSLCRAALADDASDERASVLSLIITVRPQSMAASKAKDAVRECCDALGSRGYLDKVAVEIREGETVYGPGHGRWINGWMH